MSDVRVTIGTAGSQFEVELMCHPDLKGVVLEALLVDALGHLGMASQTIGPDPLRLGHKPLAIPLIEELMGLAVAVDAPHLGEGRVH